MKRLLPFLALVAILGIVAVLWLRSKATPANEASAVERGARYLASVYEPFHYPDPYLEYVYPGESLTCPVAGCTLTYRVLDAFFNVLAFRQDGPAIAAILGRQVADATTAVNAVLPAWRTANLENTIAGRSRGTPGIALDTACILGLVEKDTVLAQHVAEFLTPGGDLLKNDEYATDRWRNIADETWCLRLFSATGVALDRLPQLLESKIVETAEHQKTSAGPSGRAAVLYHLVLLLADQSDSRYTEVLDRFRVELAELAEDPALIPDTFMQANILDALARSRYADRNRLAALALRIRERQLENGSWEAIVGSGRYPVFSTFRAVTALNQYERLVGAEG